MKTHIQSGSPAEEARKVPGDLPTLPISMAKKPCGINHAKGATQ